MVKPRVKYSLAAVFSVLFCLASGPAAATSAQDTFNTARAAYKARDEKALALYSERLQSQNYVLAPYLEYWRLLLRLEKADPDEVHAFLSKYADYPFAERVRAEWLKVLGKRQAWPQFFQEYVKLDKEDAAVACYATLGRFAQGDVNALQDGNVLWMVGIDQPSTCDGLFRVMRDNGVLAEVDVWARMRLALQANRVSVARAVSRYLDDPPDAAWLKLFDRVYENPQRSLEKGILTTRTRLGRELSLYALEQVARGQPDLASDLWNRMRDGFSREDQAYAWARMALYAARRHDPQALAWFRKAEGTPLDAEQLAWKARATLRARSWDELLAVVAAMPQAQQDQPAWRYWKGRALKEKNNLAAANALFLPLSKEHSFYGVLAQEEMGDTIGTPSTSYRPSDAEVVAVQRLPGIQRATELYQMDLRWEAKTEWLLAIRDFDDKQLIAAAELAFRQEWYDVAISTADKTALTHDFTLRYPTPYRDMMDSYVRDNQLDEAWVYGLIRQESRFVSVARSGVGASGLMQVMPATAKWIAKRMGMRDYHPGLIHRAETNIQLGTYYLRHVLDEMDGQSVMATAAYNAGPSRPKRWADGKPMEGAIYAETIPFNETRDYVQKVMANAYFYAHRLGQKLQTLKQRIGVVVGRKEALAAADVDLNQDNP
jgi:soluble lytic murein transglycosylase